MIRSRRKISALAGAAVAVTSVLLVPSPHAVAASAIPDPGLRSCIDAKLGLAADAEPTAGQLAGITDLSCTNKGIADLTGVASMPRLGKLFVGSNAVSSVEPLRGHPALFSLGLENNQLDSIDALRDVKKLSAVSLQNNRLGDLSPLSGLTLNSVTSYGQQVAGGWAPAGQSTALPTVRDRTGAVVRPDTTPDGATVSGDRVTYASAGTYSWGFHDESRYYNGTITVVVGGESPRPTAGPTATPTPAPTSTPTPTSVDTVVTIPDANFRSCITAALKVPTGSTLTTAQLSGLTGELSCPGKKIASIERAQYLTGVTKLTLSSNQIQDLGPLAGLAQLGELYIPGNQISDVTALRGLTSLTTLYAGNNHVVDLAPFAALTSLQVLDLTGNPVTTLQPLSTMTWLRELNVSAARKGPATLTSLDGVQTMSGLRKLLAHNQALTDISPLASLPDLQGFFANANQIGSLEPLRRLTKLTGLNVSGNKISDVSPLAGHSALQSLDISSNQIPDEAPIGPLPNLSTVGVLGRWQTATLAPVPAHLAVAAPLPRLFDGTPTTVTPPAGVSVADGKVTYPQAGTYVWTFSSGSQVFGGTLTQVVTDPVSDVADVPDAALRRCVAVAAGRDADALPTTADLANVTALDCADKGVVSLAGLDKATRLADLKLAGNPLTSLDQLASLPSLKKLDVSRTRLTTVAPITRLHGLDSLILDDNHLSDLTGLDAVAVRLHATGQQVTFPSITGDELAAVPSVTDQQARVFAARTPAGVTVVDGKASYALAGSYGWTFASTDGSFSGTLTQPVSRDRVDPHAHDGAAACVQQGYVWVVVERDTGLQQGGCAHKFATGYEALISAGFTTVGEAFISAINEYPVNPDTSQAYWSYWHAAPSSWTWQYSQLGATAYHPQPGTIEGWHYVSLSQQTDVDPTWKYVPPATPTPIPSATASPTPTPTPSPSPTPTPSPTPMPTPTPTPTPGPSMPVTASPTPSPVPTQTARPTPAPTSAVPKPPAPLPTTTAQPGGTLPSIALDRHHVLRGEPVAVTVCGVEAGERVRFVVHSTPLDLGYVDADAMGTARVTFPATVDVGDHELLAYLADGSVLVASFTVVAPESAVRAPALAQTGSDAPVGFVAAAVLLTLLGGALLRRRS